MRVLISGYYGFGNLGDEALLRGLLDGLRGLGHAPVVLSSDPAATSRLHDVEAVHRLRGLPLALAGVDALISGGGGLLQDATSRRSLDYYLNVMRLARLARKRVVVYGQSLGPLSAAGQLAVASTLRGVPLALRDEQSLHLAAGMGLQATLVADPALLLTPSEMNAERGPGAPVVLVPRGGQAQLNGALSELALQLAAAGVPQVAMAFHPAEDDDPVATLRGAVPQVGEWRAQEPLEAVRLLTGARYVVSVRLHGSILAAAAGVGFAGLSYDPKVRGFLAQALAPSFDLPVDARALLRISVASPAPEAHAVEHLQRLSARGIEWLGEALAGAVPGR